MSDRELVKISPFNNFLYVESSSLPKKEISSKKVSWFLEYFKKKQISEVETMPEGLQSTGVQNSREIEKKVTQSHIKNDWNFRFRHAVCQVSEFENDQPKDHNLSQLNIEIKVFYFSSQEMHS